MPEAMYLSEQDSIASDMVVSDQSTVATFRPVVVRQNQVVAPNPAPHWTVEIANKISGFVALGPNWNSYGAPRIEPNAILLSYALLVVVSDVSTPIPSVVPTVSGGVQLEWHQNGVDLEIEVLGTGNVRIFHHDANGESEWESDVNSAVERLKNMISRLGYARLRRN